MKQCYDFHHLEAVKEKTKSVITDLPKENTTAMRDGSQKEERREGREEDSERDPNPKPNDNVFSLGRV